jgi:hypothetical protein
MAKCNEMACGEGARMGETNGTEYAMGRGSATHSRTLWPLFEKGFAVFCASPEG